MGLIYWLFLLIGGLVLVFGPGELMRWVDRKRK